MMDDTGSSLSSYSSSLCSEDSKASKASSHLHAHHPHLMLSTVASKLGAAKSCCMAHFRHSEDNSTCRCPSEQSESTHDGLELILDGSTVETKRPRLHRSSALPSEDCPEVFKTDPKWDPARLIVSLVEHEVKLYRREDAVGGVCEAIPQKASNL
jgi:hypothetical protein